MKIVLASSSAYRQSILKKLQIPFEAMSPAIDESAIKDEAIDKQVLRLAIEKAKSVARELEDKQSYVIGSDQLASLHNEVLGKPGGFANAKRQLLKASGQTVRFYTGLCLYQAATEQMTTLVETFDVTFKRLTEKQLETYLNIEQPFDCAGSFKSEGLGIALFESLAGRDHNTLIGLPLIGLIELFEQMSIDLFDYMQPLP